jgi:hypothetical protein
VQTTYKRLIESAVIAGLLSCSAIGQVTKVGTTAATFLSIPVGARALGMGGAFVAVANDASAMYWNPGGLAALPHSEAIFSHANWLADIAFNYGGVALNLGDGGVVGINITSMSMSEMDRTTEDYPEGTGQTFTAGSFAVGAAYARRLTDWFFIGANVKYINEHIWNSSANGFAVDLGTLFITPYPGLKFGAGISNFGTKMRMGGDDLLVQKDISPNNGNNPNINANLATDAFDIPLTLRIGVAYDAFNTDFHHLLIAVDAAHPNDNAESLNIGGEYSLFGGTLALRGGYKALGVQDSEERYTLGGGIAYEAAAHLTARFDYAYEKFYRLNDVHKFSVAILF